MRPSLYEKVPTNCPFRHFVRKIRDNTSSRPFGEAVVYTDSAKLNASGTKGPTFDRVSLFGKRSQSMQISCQAAGLVLLVSLDAAVFVALEPSRCLFSSPELWVASSLAWTSS